MNRPAHFVLVLATAWLLAGCVSTPGVSVVERQAIAGRMMADIEVMASDAFQGRRPGTPEGERAAEYIAGQFRSAGLEPGTNDPLNAWLAPVRLVNVKQADASIAIATPDGRTQLDGDEFVALTRASRTLILDAPLLFAGYRINRISPEAARGKVVIVLARDGADLTADKLPFSKTAAAVVTVARRPLARQTLRANARREAVSLASNDALGVKVLASAAAVSRALGAETWDSLVRAAGDEDFEPVLLDAVIDLEATSERIEAVSSNVIAKLPGQMPDEGAVLLVAHWDHLGRCRAPGSPDTICNGAVDNASGVALLIELARRLQADAPFDRDIYFLATTAEEAGMLGARAFIADPPFPLDTVVAAFNFDTVALARSGSPVGFIGEGLTALDPVILAAIKNSGRRVGDRGFALEYVQRQDAWAFLQAGVPAVMLASAFGARAALDPYLTARYHSPGDETDGIELGGAIDDLLMHEELIGLIADAQRYEPPGHEEDRLHGGEAE